MAELCATWLGNASVRLRTDKTTLLFDPYVELPGGEHQNSLADFTDAAHVLITHAHLDHLASVPALLEAASPTVYCTAQAAKLLTEQAGPGNRLVTVRPGDSILIEDTEIRVFRGQHIRFDQALVRKTLRPANLHGNGRFRQGMMLKRQNQYYQENGETVFYDLHCGGLHLQLMGSLALRGDVDYPRGADVLFLPYQGSSRLSHAAGQVLERLCPKAVIVSHFDDAFPPLSQSIDTAPLAALLRRCYPEMRLLVPKFRQPISINELLS